MLSFNTVDELSEQLRSDDSASQISTRNRNVSDCAKRSSHTPCPSNDTDMQPSSSGPRVMPPSKGMGTLAHMNAHRRSHATETGQLLPRVRRKAGSGDFSTGPNISTCEAGEDYPCPRSASWPMSNSNSYDNGATPITRSAPPKREDLPLHILAKNIPLPPLRNGENSKPVPVHKPSSELDCAPPVDSRVGRQPNPASLCVRRRIAESKPCPSAWTDRMQEQLEEAQLDDQKLVNVPLTNAVLSHHNITTRKINSGFEVLPVGTLAMPTPVKEWGEGSNVSANTLDEARVPRKLLKRDRSGSRSRRPSSEHERRVKENVS